MSLAKPAGLLIVAAITFTALSCAKDELPNKCTLPKQESTLLNHIEKDPFSFARI